MTLHDIQREAGQQALQFLDYQTPIQANDYIEWINHTWCRIVPNSKYIGWKLRDFPTPTPQVIRIVNITKYR